jgi:hypothetical protein
MDDELLSQQDLKMLLGISSKRVSMLIKKGLPYIDVGEKRLFLRDSVLHWLKSQELPKQEKKLAQPQR